MVDISKGVTITATCKWTGCKNRTRTNICKQKKRFFGYFILAIHPKPMEVGSLGAIQRKDPHIWSEEEVGVWLDAIGMSGHVAAFIDQAICGDILPELTEDHLKTLGVSAFGQRKKLLAKVKALFDCSEGAWDDGVVRYNFGTKDVHPAYSERARVRWLANSSRSSDGSERLEDRIKIKCTYKKTVVAFRTGRNISLFELNNRISEEFCIERDDFIVTHKRDDGTVIVREQRQLRRAVDMADNVLRIGVIHGSNNKKKKKEKNKKKK
jgi:hypothetical protein